MTPEERAKWDVDPDKWPSTPPLHVFRELMSEDDNTWWRAGSGHGLNAYDAAIEEVERLEGLVETLRNVRFECQIQPVFAEPEHPEAPDIPPASNGAGVFR